MFIKYIENFLTPIECDEIIKIGNSNELIQMKSSQFVNGILVKENSDYAGNKRMGCYFTNEHLQTPIIKTLSDKIIKLSNELSPYNGIQYNRVPKYSFNKYEVGDFLDWHSDSHEIIKGATITYVIQLNDEYEGGDVKYLNNNIEYSVNKKQGSIFIFDSAILHSVDVVTSGIRYSINVWPSKLIKKSLI
jgi:predicted 2-oxoglutarate/Fe(II)-dependent dioxygenase YbiX